MSRGQRSKPAFMRRAEEFADEIEDRTDSFKNNELDFKTFSRLQRETWDRARKDRDGRVLLAVNRILNDWRFS